MKRNGILYPGLYTEFARRLEYLPKGKSRATKFLRSLRRDAPKWDPWIFKDGDLYRLFYLIGSDEVYPWWKQSKLCAAVSRDLQHWDDLGVILEPNPKNSWESGRIFTGCTYKEDGIYYLFYSAAGKDDNVLDERVGLAYSKDGIQWHRYSDQGLFSDSEDEYDWYGRCEWPAYPDGHFQWRDPYVVKDPKSNQYYMFICASIKTDEPGYFRGCIALAVADKITGPYTLMPPAVAPKPGQLHEWPFYHIERPQVIYRDGKYHLFASCAYGHVNPDWIKKVGHERISTFSLYWYTSDRIEGPYEPVAEKHAIPGSDKTGLYGTHLLQTNNPNEYIAYGFYYKLFSLEVAPINRVRWKNGTIEFKGKLGLFS